MWLTHVWGEHKHELAATMRREFGISMHRVSTPEQWGEAVVLAQSAAGDTSTVLGAAIAGWAYPASMVDLALLKANANESFELIAPWALSAPEPPPSEDEVAQALAELDEMIIFS